MEGQTRTFRIIAAAFAVGMAAYCTAAEERIMSKAVTISPLDVKAENLGGTVARGGQGSLVFDSSEASPKGAEFFFVRYAFTIAREGLYRLSFETDMRERGLSDYSYVIDNGKVQELVFTRLVGQGRSARESCRLEQLSAGEHTLEVRFLPAQRVRAMNRITEDYEGHRVRIHAIRLKPEQPPVDDAKREALAPHVALRRGERIVLMGDSITDEENYPGHLARIAKAAFPDSGILWFNAGISLNCACDGAERLERDVLALRPTRVVVNYGVNDAMQMTPDAFAGYFETIVQRLREKGIGVICLTPTGFHAERFPEGWFVYTRDQASALDRTAQYEAGAMAKIAKKHGCLYVDALGTLSHCDLPRDRLMGNQWHPNAEGGRMIALAILRSLGFTHADIQRTGDGADLEYWKMLEQVPEVKHEDYRSEARIIGKPERKLIAAASYTRNLVCLFSADGSEIAQVPVGHHPLGLDYSRALGELYAVCQGAARVDVIDVKSFKLKGSIQMDDDQYPAGISLAGDDRAWIGCSQGVAEIDLRARKVLRVVAVGASVQSVYAVKGANTVLAGTSKGVAVVDTAAGKVAKWVPIDCVCGFAELQGNEVAAIDTCYWRLHVLSAPGFEVKRTEQAPVRSRAIARDAAGLWAGDWQNHSIVRIPLPSGQVQRVAGVEFPLSIAVIEETAR